MRIINSINNVLYTFPDGIFDFQKWRRCLSGINTGLAAKCENDAKIYDFQKEVLPVINYALSNRNKMNSLNDAFEKTVHELKSQLHTLFEEDIELDIILYLGLCNGAGWATTLDHKDVILLGIEKIIELGWDSEDDMKALIFHEAGHIWHKTYGNMYFPAATQKEKSVLQLYQEGVAMVCEQILCQDDNYYHQNKHGWLAWCQENERYLKSEYFLRVSKGRDTQDFFGDWCSFNGHSDVGYYLGCRFVKYLQIKYTLNEIANLAYNILLEEFTCFSKGTGLD